MKSSKSAIVLSNGPQVVGTIHGAASLAAARRLRTGAMDLLELRVDAFAHDVEALLEVAPKLRAPLIVTVRHVEEGGLHAFSTPRRRELFEKFLPHASAIDVELRSVKEMSAVLVAARACGVRVILSHHDFQRTPSAQELHVLARRAATVPADVFKVAALTSRARDVAILLDFLTHETRLRLSVMGMGDFGRVSRLLFAACGSVLNYGYLDTANASGQWPAALLKKRVAEVCASATREPDPQ